MSSSQQSFRATYIIEPTGSHTHTAILLHGRGSTGEEFAEELSETLSSSHQSIMQSLPTWRFVFPSSPSVWNAIFEEDVPAWFDAQSLTDVTARQDLQLDGIRKSVEHIKGIVRQEIMEVGGRASRVVLGGISQGAAVGMMALLSIKTQAQESSPGAFVAANTWLPFAANIENLLSTEGSANAEAASHDDEDDHFVASLINFGAQNESPLPFLMGHGKDDAYVDVALGRHARDVLKQAGFRIKWNEYEGAEQEGHWLKEPEQMDDIIRFLRDLPEV